MVSQLLRDIANLCVSSENLVVLMGDKLLEPFTEIMNHPKICHNDKKMLLQDNSQNFELIVHNSTPFLEIMTHEDVPSDIRTKLNYNNNYEYLQSILKYHKTWLQGMTSKVIPEEAKQNLVSNNPLAKWEYIFPDFETFWSKWY